LIYTIESGKNKYSLCIRRKYNIDRILNFESCNNCMDFEIDGKSSLIKKSLNIPKSMLYILYFSFNFCDSVVTIKAQYKKAY
jgi:hypothetical protein